MIALIGSGTQSTHPNPLATYSTRTVTIKIINSEAKKAIHPYFQWGGGTRAKNNSQPIVIK